MSSREIDTIVLGVPCTIKYDYQPYEAAEAGPEARYPGCEESVEVTDVLVGGVSVWEWVDCHLDMHFTDAVHEYRKAQHEQYLEDRAERKWNSRFDDY